MFYTLSHIQDWILDSSSVCQHTWKSICKHNKHLYIASSRLLKKLQRKPDQEYQHIKFTSLTPLILTVNSLLATQVSGQLCVYSRLHAECLTYKKQHPTSWISLLFFSFPLLFPVHKSCWLKSISTDFCCLSCYDLFYHQCRLETEVLKSQK